jgi:hypothetical protein
MQSSEGTSSQTIFSVTPLDKIKEKVVTTPGPWSQQLLDLLLRTRLVTKLYAQQTVVVLVRKIS